MKKAHLDFKKTVIAISTAVGLSLTATTLNAASGETVRLKSAAQPKMQMKKPPIAVPQKCTPGFKRANHQLGYTCTSGKAACTKPYFAENLHVAGKSFSYVCRDPASVPK